MSEAPNNPADRLYRLLRDAQAVRQADRTIVKAAWTSVLQLKPRSEGDPVDDALLLERLGDVMRLPRLIREQVETVAQRPDLYLDKLGKLEGALQQGMVLNAKWKQVLDKVDTGAMEQLRHTGNLLSAELPEPPADEERLKELHDTVRQLFDEVSSSTIDDDIRDFLLPHIISLDQAIGAIRVRGGEGVTMAASAAIGQWVLAKIDPPPSTSKAREVWDRFWSVTGKALRFAGYVGHAARGLNTGIDLLAELPLWDLPELGSGDGSE